MLTKIVGAGRTLVLLAALGSVPVVGLFAVGGRSLGELARWAQASAQVAITASEHEIPDEVVDAKRAQELAMARRDLTDRQVKFKLLQVELQKIEREITVLSGTIESRKTLLIEAAGVVAAAKEKGQAFVEWGSRSFSMSDFLIELEGLTNSQEVDEHLLTAKKANVLGLQRSIEACAEGLRELAKVIDNASSQEQTLLARREQAKLEQQTLSLMEGTSSSDNPYANSLRQLQNKVDRIEASNDVCRANLQSHTNTLARESSILQKLEQVSGLSLAPRKVTDETQSAPASQAVEASSTIQVKTGGSTVEIQVK